MRSPAFFAVLLLAAGLSGCGSGSTKKAPKAETGIFISSSDCASAGKLTIDQCGQVIDVAVALHQNRAPSYRSLTACAAAEGPDRCARGVDGRYQPNVQAFLVTFSEPPSATPLYATSDGSLAFKGLDKQKFGLNDDGSNFSESAATLAHQNARLPTKS